MPAPGNWLRHFPGVKLATPIITYLIGFVGRSDLQNHSNMQLAYSR